MGYCIYGEHSGGETFILHLMITLPREFMYELVCEKFVDKDIKRNISRVRSRE